MSTVFPVVGVGASAGGLKPLESFFQHIPEDTGAAFVVLQHLSPRYKSVMDELLTRRTEMPVQVAEDGMALKPNTVTLAPPGQTLLYRDGKVFFGRMVARAERLRTIDHFLESLSTLGSLAIGVVLSGTGTDGTIGLQQIHAAGGVTMVQSPDSAQFDGMPLSAVSTGIVDFILPPWKLADAM
ncbi:MAG: chemotaxis protein CheB, partial [Myxococcota bacterium]